MYFVVATFCIFALQFSTFLFYNKHNSCKANNSNDFIFCSSCGQPRPKIKLDPNDWICDGCGAQNRSDFTFCSICGQPKPQPKLDEWVCNCCGAHNKSDSAFCSACGQPRSKSDNQWSCRKCGHKNNISDSYCSKCGAPKDYNPPISVGLIAAITIGIVIVILLIILIVNTSNSKSDISPSSTPVVAEAASPIQTFAPSQESSDLQVITPLPESDEEWGAWSSWSTEYVSSSPTREVQTDTAIIGYNMVHYGTQLASTPHYRMFRDYSINGNLSEYNARTSYGEKHLTKQVTAEQIETAVVYPPNGSFITLRGINSDESYGGYQMGNTEAYNFGDDLLVWFIESPIYGSVYRYRDLITRQ